VCSAPLNRNGIKIVSQRDYVSLEILYSRIDPADNIELMAKGHDQIKWYFDYFKKMEDKNLRRTI